MGGLCCKGTKEPESEAELSEEVDGDVGQISCEEPEGMGDNLTSHALIQRSSLDVIKKHLAKPKSENEDSSNEPEESIPHKVSFSVDNEK